MSLANPSPICTVNAASTLNGVDVTTPSTFTIALVDTAGVKTWAITCINTDELNVPASVTGGLTIDSIAKTARSPAPAAGSALIFQSQVNQGRDANGAADPSLTTTFGVYVLTSSTFRVGAFDETTEGSAAFGWIAKLNPVIRNNLVTPASGGAGMSFSAGAYNVGANADGSIVVNADDIQLKPAYSALLDGATSAATANTLAKRGTLGAVSFGVVTCTGVVNSGNATVGGTLGVTGSSTLAALVLAGNLTATTATFSGAITASSITAPTTSGFALSNGTKGSDVATSNVTITPMLPFASAVTNKKPGDVVIALPQAAGGSTVVANQAAVIIQRNSVSYGKIYEIGDGTRFRIEALGGAPLGLELLTADVAATSGAVFLRSGNSSANDTGLVFVTSGTTVANSKTSGRVSLESGATAGNSSASGNAGLATGATAGTTSASGSIFINSGDATQSGSGNINIYSGSSSAVTNRGNISLGASAGSYGGGAVVIFLANRTTTPTSNPVGGGILYVNAGVLRYRGSSGTDTQLALA